MLKFMFKPIRLWGRKEPSNGTCDTAEVQEVAAEQEVEIQQTLGQAIACHVLFREKLNDNYKKLNSNTGGK